MRLSHEYKALNGTEHQASQESLKGDLEDLKRIHRDLTYSGGIRNSEAKRHIDAYNRIINSSDFKKMVHEKSEYYEECSELVNKISLVIENVNYEYINSPGIFNIPSNEERMTSFYNELESINAVLSAPETTESQAVEVLKKYQKLINDKKNIKLMNDAHNETARKATKINDEIQDYLMRQDMVTFGYFVDRMDNASKYSYNISVKYQRESMNKYVDFYKVVTTKLNTFGDYIKESVDDGKKNKVYKRKYYAELYHAMKPYFYHGDGNGYILYENNIKLIKVGDDKFNVLVGGELVDTGISYKEAYGKMEYFFSCHEPVIKGTRLCKLFNPVKDESGNIIGLEGKVEQFLFPTEFYNFMEFAYNEHELDHINKNFDKAFKGNPPTLSNWDRVNEQSIAATSNVEYTKEALKINYDAGIYDYYTNKEEQEVTSNLYQHDINSINQKIDGAKKGLQLTLDEYTQRYNTINSNYDNMLRTITTMISELAQELKGFLRF
ncbi:hypothetical protein LH673_13520 [Morganella morganii]|uniref:hypothetical protein n=1 Tax=Morganella morganii TaxID=582 RepID=UPI001F27E72F|nr:hypothetical protein [Morganella morganii]MCF1266414.1 hypothetical protein [Morganella morganii]